jgi:aminoglycoside 3-N-acetyltransferase
MTSLKRLVAAALDEAGLERLRTLRRHLRKLGRSLQRPIGETELLAQLRDAGIAAGDVVMVHSSLARLGKVRGGAPTVVRALQQAVGVQGTILMPAYSSAKEAYTRLAAGQMIDLRTDRCAQGAIPEAFRLWPRTLRSSHPFSSVCAWGRHAAFVTSGHQLDPRICHSDSPIGRLLQLEGKVLGLGIDMGPVSFYHVIEDTWDGFPFDPYDEPRPVTYVDADGTVITRLVRSYAASRAKNRIDDYAHLWIRRKITEVFDERSHRRTFRFGHGHAWVVPATECAQELKLLAAKGITIYLDEKQWTVLGQPSFMS